MTYQSDFYEFNHISNELTDLVEKSNLDISMEKSVFYFAETALQAKELNEQSAKHLKYIASQLPNEYHIHYHVLKPHLQYWMSDNHYSDLRFWLAKCKQFSSYKLLRTKDAAGNETFIKHYYLDDLLSKVSEYSKILDTQQRSLTALYD